MQELIVWHWVAGLREEVMPAHWHFLIPMLHHQLLTGKLFIFPHKTGRFDEVQKWRAVQSETFGGPEKRAVCGVRFIGSDIQRMV